MYFYPKIRLVLIQQFHQLFKEYLSNYYTTKAPRNLYDPEAYILGLGGKRLRPILTLIATEAFGGVAKNSLPAALAVEVFHNFTLLHDDVMDAASIRRGKATVHQKWNINTAILSGDVMLIKAYRLLESYDASIFKDLQVLFSKTAIEVCEGQQYDMDFETKDHVSLSEYMMMITYKTSVLLAAALQMGAIVAGASKKEQEKIYNFGIQLGLAFQLQDDFLDTFGNQDSFGKRIGGDILEKKKTWLYCKMASLLSESDLNDFKNRYNKDVEDETDKIITIQALFKKHQIDRLITTEIKKHSTKALAILEELAITSSTKNALKALVLQLEDRKK